MVAEVSGLGLENIQSGPYGNATVHIVDFKSEGTVDASDSEENPIRIAHLPKGMRVYQIDAVVHSPGQPNGLTIDVGYMADGAETDDTASEDNFHDLDFFFDGIDVGTADGSGNFHYSSIANTKHERLHIKQDDVYLMVNFITTDATATVEIQFIVHYEWLGTRS